MKAVEFVVWDSDGDRRGNAEHVAGHFIGREEVEHVLVKPLGEETSRSSGRPIRFGLTPEGRFIAVVFDWVGDDGAYPVTAYDVDPPA